VPVWAAVPWQRGDHLRVCYHAKRHTVTLARNGGPPSAELAFAGGPPPPGAASAAATAASAAAAAAAAGAAAAASASPGATASFALQSQLCVCVASRSDGASGASRFHVLRALDPEEAALYTRDAAST
jgi:hypothetical protein